MSNLTRIQQQYRRLLRYNDLMRFSLGAHKNRMTEDEKSELLVLKAEFNFVHTAQAGLRFSEGVLLEYEVLSEENDALKAEIEALKLRPRGFWGIV